MASHNSVGTQLVLDGCKEYPHWPSRTLARKLFKENKGVWTNLEVCRSAIQYRRGRLVPRSYAGGPTRKCKDIVPSTAPSVQHVPSAYIPQSDEKDFLPHVIDVDRDSRALVLSDIHIPYHNIPALRAAIDNGKKKECNIIVVNGDFLDFHKLSRFMKDPRARSAKGEIDRGNELLDALDESFPKARKIYKAGNHDERYDHYIMSQAEEIFEILKAEASLDKLLELEDRGWEYVTEKRPIYAGHLTICHGHEWPTPVLGPVNAARGLFLRTKASALVGHHHQTSEHTEPTVRGKMITTWSTGCLCELHPMYARFNKWNHGAAMVDLAQSGEFKVHNFRIQDGQMMN